MNNPATARRGVIIGEIGMLLAVIGTLLRPEVVEYRWILIGLGIGSAIGAPLAYLMPMTAVPQLTALSHAFGALASALIGTAEFYKGEIPLGFPMGALVLESLLGFLTTTASIIAFAKLQELMPTRPMTYKGQNVVSLSMLTAAIVIGGWMVAAPAPTWAFPAFIALSDGIRHHAGDPDRRGGHAHRDRAAQFLCRRGGGRHGFRAEQPAADHRRRAQRIGRFDPVDHHVQGHEPVVHQRSCLGRSGNWRLPRPVRWPSGRSARRPPTKPRRFWIRRAPSS